MCRCRGDWKEKKKTVIVRGKEVTTKGCKENARSVPARELEVISGAPKEEKGSPVKPTVCG